VFGSSLPPVEGSPLVCVICVYLRMVVSDAC